LGSIYYLGPVLKEKPIVKPDEDDHIPPGHPKPKYSKFLMLIKFGVLISVSILLHVASKGFLAALYIFANDGKFSGRMSGNVMQRNGRTRMFVVPPLIRNAYTMLQRGRFTTQSAAYKSLTASQIVAWQGASFATGSDRFGNPVFSKGKNAFVSCNVNLIDTGQATIVTPVVGAPTPAILTATLTMAAGAGTVSLAYGASPTNAAVEHMFFCTKPLLNTIGRPSKSAFRFTALIAHGSATPANLAAAYIAKFGAITGFSGRLVYFQLWAVNNLSGEKIPSVGGVCTIAA